MTTFTEQFNNSQDIRVKLQNGLWVSARHYQISAFNNFMNSPNLGIHPFEYDNGIFGENKIKFVIKREYGQKNYLVREDQTIMPIVNWNDVKVFLLNLPNQSANWYNARDYQTWAYFDFVYSGDVERYYMSQSSSNIDRNKRYITMPINTLPPNIVFRMSRNDNGTVFYEKNDNDRTKVRINDNNAERNGYMGFYNRMTEPLFPITFPNLTIQQSVIPRVPDGIVVTTTSNDDEMCVCCNTNKQNIKFLPCNHINTCSECYMRIVETGPKCPLCRATISQIVPLIQPENNNTIIQQVHNNVRQVHNNVRQVHDNHPKSDDWFECAFGFKEHSYSNAKSQFDRMITENGNVRLNGILIGKFELFNGRQLHDMFPNTQSIGRITIENIIRDIKAVHKNPIESENATIQVASQFNCLEMIDETITPEQGITIYKNDNTQGPICAISTPAGLAYRNYLYNGGQTCSNQIDMTIDLLTYLKTFDRTITWNMKNGYLMFGNERDLRKINKILSTNSTIRNFAKSVIQSGSHSGQGVFVQCTEYQHTVNHVYCSGLPISYNTIQYELWDGLAEIFLEAMYENTLLIACMNNKKTNQNKPCYLTQLGGGVFGMKHSQIVKAIIKACNVISKKGLNLDVKIVHYGNINQNYINLPQTYPTHIESIWNNDKWIENFA